MSHRRQITVDGNEAAASVAYRTNEVIALYPITPSSTMGELADEWANQGKQNIWGVVPTIAEMQSEGGAIGAIHGALQAGSLATTFTASQGLLLMIPNLYKIAGELTSYCMHVTARTIATHALSIFGDHSDVMACRQTGFAMLASASAQEAHDFALIAQASTLRARIPFMHFFDGFRTSHEIAKIELLDDDDLRYMLADEYIAVAKKRALTPDRPVLRGTAQNPDVFFQAREAINPYYAACPDIVQEMMNRFAERVGRHYQLFDYVGHPDADRVIITMGSSAETAVETANWLNARGQKVGVLIVRLYRPFSLAAFTAALPKTVRSIAVLDRTKEPGALGDPLYLDVIAALEEAYATGLPCPTVRPTVIAGRYGLASKEFTPAMVKAVFDELTQKKPRRHFTVGIFDDVSNTSLNVDPEFDIEPDDVVRAVFFGLGADGTVGANKNSIKIIGEDAGCYAQGYFVYDSKKSGAMTISHLRFGARPIHAPYLIRHASFVACHQENFLDKYDVLAYAAPNAVFLLNTASSAADVWTTLSRDVQEALVGKKLQFYVIDAMKVANATGMGSRINTIMQTCFFAISGVLPKDEAIAQIKAAIEKTYRRKGEEIIRRNFAAVDQTLENLHRVEVPAMVSAQRSMPPPVSDAAPDFVKHVTAMMLANKGDLLPVSAFPPDGTWPLGTARWEKRDLAQEIPVWDSELCIQCNKCAMVCPHAAIRAKVYDPKELVGAPDSFKSVDYKTAEFEGFKYTIQVAPEDCTGCNVCVMVCPAKDRTRLNHKAIDMMPQPPLRQAERQNYSFFLDLPEADRTRVKQDVKGSQLLQPLFEYSGACAGCGETPYLKLLTQLFGDRIYIANATGCSSIYGGNLPTTPYSTNKEGRGPAWINSLFEDNAEFGLGIRLGADKQAENARFLLGSLSENLGAPFVAEILNADQSDEAGVIAQRARVVALRAKLADVKAPAARQLEVQADYLCRKDVWIVGGDGWAYDIGFGGLDHVLASGQNINILVLDTEVYSNTGGQQSKSTPMGAAAKFASGGKTTAKKDLGQIAMSYGNVFVARVAFGARDTQTLRALQDAASYPGVSLIIAYSHCIAHGYDMARALDQQKLAVETAYWPLYRYDPRREATGESPLVLESAPPKRRLKEFTQNEARFRIVEQQNPGKYRELIDAAQKDLAHRFALYQEVAKPLVPARSENGKSAASDAPKVIEKPKS